MLILSKKYKDCSKKNEEDARIALLKFNALFCLSSCKGTRELSSRL